MLQKLTLDKDSFRSIVAYYPQSTIGDKVCKVWYQSMDDDKWPKGKARICMNNHDALIGLSPKKYAKTCLRIMKKYAEEPVRIISVDNKQITNMIIPADLKMSVADEQGYHRWSSLKGLTL